MTSLIHGFVVDTIIAKSTSADVKSAFRSDVDSELLCEGKRFTAEAALTDLALVLTPYVIFEVDQAFQPLRTILTTDFRRLSSSPFYPCSMTQRFPMSFSLHFGFKLDEAKSKIKFQMFFISFIKTNRKNKLKFIHDFGLCNVNINLTN